MQTDLVLIIRGETWYVSINKMDSFSSCYVLCVGQGITKNDGVGSSFLMTKSYKFLSLGRYRTAESSSLWQAGIPFTGATKLASCPSYILRTQDSAPQLSKSDQRPVNATHWTICWVHRHATEPLSTCSFERKPGWEQGEKSLWLLVPESWVSQLAPD